MSPVYKATAHSCAWEKGPRSQSQRLEGNKRHGLHTRRQAVEGRGWDGKCSGGPAPSPPGLLA